MLDPLSALGLAASVVQFADFTAKVIKQANEIHEAGKPIGITELQHVTKNLQDLSESFRQRVQTQTLDTSSDIPSLEENALDELFRRCNRVAEDLIGCLNRIIREEKTGRWETIRAALLSVWHDDKIKAFSDTLQIYRQELVLRILVLLDARSTSHARQIGDRFDNLDQSSQQIVEVVAINQSRIQDAFEHQAQSTADQYSRNKIDLERRHAETIAAILTLRDGTTQTISRRPEEQRDHRIGTSGLSQTALTLRRETRSKPLVDPTDYGNKAALADFDPVSQKVLNALFFRQMDHRYEEVATAHQKTFDWIFDNTGAETPWDNLVDWLKYGDGCYWVSGKAGSGKSTLMKYISEHSKTREALLTWAAGKDLIITSFFFWNLGSPMQKSQIGLLRSLLFDMLQTRQHLIPLTFPGLCRAGLSDSPDFLYPTLAELKKAFTILLRQKDNSFCMCFLIDGIDEYDGDHAEISKLFTSIADHPSVKFLLSSRPIPACVDAFSTLPNLRLQDLTYNDIHLYVQDELGNHPNMKKLESRHEEQARALIVDITKKASGVFLWVILVVKSLLTGLRNYDRIEDLQRRLGELPADLEHLYQHMLGSMSLEYRAEASIILQLVLNTIEIQQLQPLTALQLSYAEENDPASALRAAIAPISDGERQDRQEVIEGRVRARCCGLVEVQGKRHRKFLWSEEVDPTVAFLHKTVVEFLRQPNVQSYMADFVAENEFDASLALSSSCLYMIKTMVYTKAALAEDGALLRYATYCLRFLLLLSGVSRSLEVDLLKSLDSTMKQAGRGSKPAYGTKHWSIAAMKAQGEPVAPSFARLSRDNCFGIIWLAAWLGKTSSVKELLAQNMALDQAMLDSSMTAFLGQLMLSFFGSTQSPANFVLAEDRSGPLAESAESRARLSYQICIAAVLQRGADPNAKCMFWDDDDNWLRVENLVESAKMTEGPFWTLGKDCSAWQFFLAYAANLRPSYMGRGTSWLPDVQLTVSLVESFLDAGADVNAIVPFRTTRRRFESEPITYRKSAMGILKPMFQRLLEGTEALGLKIKDISTVSTIEDIYDHMERHGAVMREWQNDKLTSGPPVEEPGAKWVEAVQATTKSGRAHGQHSSMSNTPLTPDRAKQGSRSKLAGKFKKLWRDAS